MASPDGPANHFFFFTLPPSSPHGLKERRRRRRSDWRLFSPLHTYHFHALHHTRLCWIPTYLPNIHMSTQLSGFVFICTYHMLSHSCPKANIRVLESQLSKVTSTLTLVSRCGHPPSRSQHNFQLETSLLATYFEIPSCMHDRQISTQSSYTPILKGSN